MVLNYPLSDVSEEEYQSQLFEAAQHLHEMVDKQGHHVLLCCSSGVSRAPTLALVYLALFLKHKHWNNVPELERFIKKSYIISRANTLVASQVGENNKEFQAQQKARYEDEDERRRLQREEEERQRLLKIEKDEAERLRL